MSVNIPSWLKVNTLKKVPKTFRGHHDNKSLNQGSIRDITQSYGPYCEI